MGKVTGFLEEKRVGAAYRDADERMGDYAQVQEPIPEEVIAKQASRCMDCGIPFCNNGCPLGNIIDMKKSPGISQIARNATGGKINMMVRSGHVSE